MFLRFLSVDIVLNKISLSLVSDSSITADFVSIDPVSWLPLNCPYY